MILISERGPSTLSFQSSKGFLRGLFLLISKEDSDAVLKDLIAASAKRSKGMKFQPINL